jgi:hypothetical protein
LELVDGAPAAVLGIVVAQEVVAVEVAVADLVVSTCQTVTS